jgi:hypothetical protein
VLNKLHKQAPWAIAQYIPHKPLMLCGSFPHVSSTAYGLLSCWLVGCFFLFWCSLFSHDMLLTHLPSYKKYGFIPFCALIWRLSTQSFRRRTYCTTALCNSFVARPCNKVSWRKDLQKCFAWMIPFSTRLVRACSTPALSKSGPQKLDTKTHKQKCTKRCRAGRYLQRFWCLVIICYHLLSGAAQRGGNDQHPLSD